MNKIILIGGIVFVILVIAVGFYSFSEFIRTNPIISVGIFNGLLFIVNFLMLYHYNNKNIILSNKSHEILEFNRVVNEFNNRFKFLTDFYESIQEKEQVAKEIRDRLHKIIHNYDVNTKTYSVGVGSIEYSYYYNNLVFMINDLYAWLKENDLSNEKYLYFRKRIECFINPDIYCIYLHTYYHYRDSMSIGLQAKELLNNFIMPRIFIRQVSAIKENRIKYLDIYDRVFPSQDT